MLGAMYRPLIVAALFALAPSAAAAQRSYIVTDFDRVRVDGTFDVTLVVGDRGASGTAQGDAKVLTNLDISVENGTLVVRKRLRNWGDPRDDAGAAPRVTLTTRQLRSATVIGGGKLAISGKLQGRQIDFQVTGNGSIDASGINADEVQVTLIGGGRVALVGHAGHARLLSDGAGNIAASPLDVGDVLIRLDGYGEIRAHARYTADLTSNGLGRIVVSGTPKCVVRKQTGGPIQCGTRPAN